MVSSCFLQFYFSLTSFTCNLFLNVLLPRRLSALSLPLIDMNKQVHYMCFSHCVKCNIYTYLGTDLICGACRRKTLNFMLSQGCVIKKYPDRIPEQLGGVYIRGRKDVVSWSFPQAIPTMQASTQNVELRSLYFRHCANVGKPNADILKKFHTTMLRFWKNKFGQLLQRLDLSLYSGQLLDDLITLRTVGRLLPSTSEYVWLWLRNFPPSKRKEKEDEFKKCLERPEMFNAVFEVPPRKVFVKREKESQSTLFGVSRYPDARGIQGFDAHTNIRLGPWMTRIQNVVEAVLSPVNSNIIFACGLSGDMISDLFQRLSKSDKVFEDDFTLYDTTFNRTMHQMVVEFYRYLGVPEVDLDIRLQQVDGTGVTRHGCKFEVLGSMKSGASDTCLGNSIINVLSHVWCLSKENKITLEKAWNNLLMAVLGDDNVFVMPSYFRYAMIKQNMADIGLLSKIDVKGNMNYTFLNFIPFPCIDRVRAVLKPGRILSRIQVSDTPQASFIDYQAGVALGLIGMSRDVPILYSFLQRLSVRSDNTSAIYERYMKRHLYTENKYVTVRTMIDVWFMERYGFDSKILQKELNEFPLEGMFSHPLLKIMFEVDGVLKE